MNVQDLINRSCFNVISEGEDLMKEITKPFCCDLLSIAMSKAPAGSAWVTVMGNVNTLAVATLADISCIILAEGTMLDQVALEKAKIQKITVLSSDLPIFNTALTVHNLINDSTNL